jgi:hypothetical protein
MTATTDSGDAAPISIKDALLMAEVALEMPELFDCLIFDAQQKAAFLHAVRATIADNLGCRQRAVLWHGDMMVALPHYGAVFFGVRNPKGVVGFVLSVRGWRPFKAPASDGPDGADLPATASPDALRPMRAWFETFGWMNTENTDRDAYETILRDKPVLLEANEMGVGAGEASDVNQRWFLPPEGAAMFAYAITIPDHRA